MDLVLIQVGGTIDKDYPTNLDNHGYEFRIGDAAYCEIMERARPAYIWSEDSAMQKDSLDMDNDDRSYVRDCVDSRPEKKVVITHGTDTIRMTAEKLTGIVDKTIVLTGADLPEKFKDSNADFNLGLAIGAVQSLPPGVYIALYGEVVPWNEFKPR